MTADVEESTVRLEGRRIRFRVQGQGRPVLLLNGIGAPLETWRSLYGRLTGLRTIAFDTLGSGRSQSPRGPLPIAGHARLALRLLDHLECRTVAALGFSFGGMVAQELALLGRGRVDRLVLASTTCGWGGLAGPASLRALAEAAAYHSTLERAGGASGSRRRPEGHRLGHVNQLWAATTWTSAPWLHLVRQPTLVLTGDADRVVPAANARILAALLPNARLHVVPGGGHLCLLDRAAETAPVLRSFLLG
jgi:pimeloyl-ACP methyl ester carboxylesterase